MDPLTRKINPGLAPFICTADDANSVRVECVEASGSKVTPRHKNRAWMDLTHFPTVQIKGSL